MKVAIVGSRTGFQRHVIRAYVTGLTVDDVVVTGGARGVDTWAEEIATELGMGVEIHPADWEKFGKSAGFVRNVDIVAAADRVVAFWDGESKGTKHSIDQALAQRKPLEVWFP